MSETPLFKQISQVIIETDDIKSEYIICDRANPIKIWLKQSTIYKV